MSRLEPKGSLAEMILAALIADFERERGLFLLYRLMLWWPLLSLLLVFICALCALICSLLKKENAAKLFLKIALAVIILASLYWLTSYVLGAWFQIYLP